ncbi:hypothetical protein OG455_41385 [Kitasatospora sp. NBC_01287]|uniref:hypothetical protein n=1 Tax=Kitasatospora sp. NBC_01287 TaxID=2903573 RepID=UPI002250C63B|nr:hypothetical protein [Kitasatospora sp. NBC_01287]MCX4750937.1 hypothetical protein [Kitasatospora sp. NBC_01287]MCX4751812.1 hypothetical protein [Kitasatospora sp. NBC_01287]MCX4751896.1 hypothetical protein [Kitasatospora sp. NBC_01287]
MTTTWPDGVIARYLTVGGATVDIEDIDPDRVTAWCFSPCGSTRTFLGPHLYEQDQPIRDAKAWSQAHAETCRARPRPNGAQR